MTQERIAEMEKQLQELTKQLAEIKQGQAQEFKLGWYCIKGLSGNNWLVLNPQVKNRTVYGDLLILDFVRMEQISERGIINCDSIEYHRPATPEEVKNALQEVCKRKGIVPGATVKRPENLIKDYAHSLGISAVEKITDDKHPSYVIREDSLVIDGITVYYRGQFAEVVKEPEEKITIGGYEVRYNAGNGGTTIEGYNFTKEFWQAAKVVAENSKAAVIVGCEAKRKGLHSWVASLETINKILKRLEK